MSNIVNEQQQQEIEQSAAAVNLALAMVRAAGFVYADGTWVLPAPAPLTEESTGVRMAVANKADRDAAMTVATVMDSIEKGFMPADMDSDEDFFDIEDPIQCYAAMKFMLEATKNASLFRVAFGMDTILNPKNEVIDPDADHLCMHPKWVRALSALDAMKEVASSPQVPA